MLSDYCRPGVANTNSAMNARLMKYAASTRPTVMKNGVNSRPWAYPPPMIRPPPISAPAVMMALGSSSIPFSSL
jgi:hypothetical protein